MGVTPPNPVAPHFIFLVFVPTSQRYQNGHACHTPTKEKSSINIIITFNICSNAYLTKPERRAEVVTYSVMVSAVPGVVDFEAGREVRLLVECRRHHGLAVQR